MVLGPRDPTAFPQPEKQHTHHKTRSNQSPMARGGMSQNTIMFRRIGSLRSPERCFVLVAVYEAENLRVGVFLEQGCALEARHSRNAIQNPNKTLGQKAVCALFRWNVTHHVHYAGMLQVPSVCYTSQCFSHYQKGQQSQMAFCLVLGCCCARCEGSPSNCQVPVRQCCWVS